MGLIMKPNITIKELTDNKRSLTNSTKINGFNNNQDRVRSFYISISDPSLLELRKIWQPFSKSIDLTVADTTMSMGPMTLCQDSGSRFASCLIFRDHQSKNLVVINGNLGDVSTILITVKSKVVVVRALNKLHTPQEELKTDEKFNGLEYTRSIGDLNAGTRKDPSYAEMTLEEENDTQNFVVLFSRGITDVFSQIDLVHYLQESLDTTNSPINTADILNIINFAEILWGERSTDQKDISCLVFDVASIPEENIAAGILAQGNGDNGHLISETAVNLWPKKLVEMLAVQKRRVFINESQQNLICFNREVISLNNRLIVLRPIHFKFVQYYYHRFWENNETLIQGIIENIDRLIINIKISLANPQDFNRNMFEFYAPVFIYFLEKLHNAQNSLKKSNDISNNLLLVRSAMHFFTIPALVTSIYGPVAHLRGPNANEHEFQFNDNATVKLQTTGEIGVTITSLRNNDATSNDPFFAFPSNDTQIQSTISFPRIIQEKYESYRVQFQGIAKEYIRIVPPNLKPATSKDWLDDHCVNDFFRIIELSSENKIACVLSLLLTPEVDAYINKRNFQFFKRLRDADKIFWPYCINKHWGLLIIDHKVADNTCKVTMVDGFNTNYFLPENRETYELLKLNVTALLNNIHCNNNNYNANQTRYLHFSIPKQSNTYDCGVAICYFAKQFAEKDQLAPFQNLNAINYSPYRFDIAQTLSENMNLVQVNGLKPSTVVTYEDKKRVKFADLDAEVVNPKHFKNNNLKK